MKWSLFGRRLKKFSLGQSPAPLPTFRLDVASPTLRQAIAEAIAWDVLAKDKPEAGTGSGLTSLGWRFRSASLEPDPPLINSFTDEAWQMGVAQVIVKRAALLRERKVTVDRLLLEAKGRLLIYFPLETVCDGAAQASSRGFCDENDCPPWDLWVNYEAGELLCWVPESLIDLAQAGIGANPVDCIHWQR